MEVHHHAHTSRRKWTHYFWEFLMLFLAVLCGFLAENQREHFVEHQREKVYAANLHVELKKDTTQLNELVADLGSISRRLDTLCLLLRANSGQQPTSGRLYYYAAYVTDVDYFSSNNTTVEQLKGSGNLRIMGNELAYKISAYDKAIRDLEKEYGLSKTEFAKIEDLHFKIFDMYILETTFPRPLTKPRDSIFRLTDLPVNDDPAMRREYTGWVKFESGVYQYQIDSYLLPLKKLATDLLAFLKKEYHLE